jgi:hypothetical protein
MCLICLDWQKGNMTSKEAFSAINEIVSTEKDETKLKHIFELSNKILEKEAPYSEWDEDLHGHYIEGLDYDPSTED